MWPKQDRLKHLRSLSARIEAADNTDAELVSDVRHCACPRLASALAPAADLARLVDAGAWLEVGLRLIAWELPDWSVHRLDRDDCGWCCSIGISGLASNWMDDVVEFQHHSLSLAVLGAFVQAQLRKTQGVGLSNITPFRQRTSTDHRAGATELRRDDP
jgi:hypothetical protein